jgi:hypothetical protein
MKSLFVKTVSTALLLASSLAGASQRNMNYSCEIDNNARYKNLNFSLIIGVQDGQSRALGITTELIGTRRQTVRTLVVPTSPPQPAGTDSGPTSVQQTKPIDLFGKDSQRGAPGSLSIQDSRYSNYVSSQSMAPASGSGSYLIPQQQWVESEETVGTIENLIYDYDYELVKQQIDHNDAEEINKEISIRNELLKAERQQQLDASADSFPVGQKNPNFPELQLEPLLPLPRPILPLVMKAKNAEAKRGQPKSTLNIQMDGTEFANLECTQTFNPVDNVSDIEKDIKGGYNKQATDPRAAKGSAGFGLPATINRVTREWWCKQRTLVGKMDLSFFNKGVVNVRCEYQGETTSDN